MADSRVYAFGPFHCDAEQRLTTPPSATRYLIVAKLPRVVRPTERIAGDRFTAPLTLRGVGLEGTLFLSQQPLRLKLRKR
jgi:hypothetical protein